MLSFSQFIAEGGNVKINNVSAQNIDMSVAGKRRAIQTDVAAMLSHIHTSFHQEHGEHLFGTNAQAMNSGEIYSGSTKAMMDRHIPDSEFGKYKPNVGDIDVKIPAEHAEKLVKHLTPGRKFGKYTVVGHKKSGTEIHALMTHEDGSTHQIDFEKTQYENGRPHPFEQFGHSSHWDDIKSGIKGVHHKVLLNAIGLENHKFSNSKGLMSRTDETAAPIRDTHQITKTLFGSGADETHLHSFKGLIHLVKNHLPKEQHGKILTKFTDSLKGMKGDHSAPLAYARAHLGGINESVEDHHVSVIPLTGFVPISHMGHAKDLGEKLKSLPGEKHLGVSGKSELFTPEQRANILHKQWGIPGLNVHVDGSGGSVVAKAFHSLPEGRRHLHLLAGADRAPFVERLKQSLEAGKIPEMNGGRFDSITIHYPEDTGRSHGMSGTKMRNAAASGNIDEFHRHLGPMFSRQQANKIMGKVKHGLESGAVPLDRTKKTKKK